ncbi:MAG: hypothetical protein AB7Q69_14790 [Gemmatimonadales bacterium]
MRSVIARGGFGLPEFVVALALTAVLAAVLVQLLVRQAWVARAQQESALRQEAVRAGGFFLPAELRDLGGPEPGGDLLAGGPDSIVYRATRGLGTACGLGPTGLLLEDSTLSGYRSPQPGRDSLLLFVDGNPALISDDRWVALPILGTAPASCGGASALFVATALDTSQVPLSAVPLPAPVRVFEIMEIRSYLSSGDWWLGARSVSAGEAVQPVLGPLETGGLTLRYLDSVGAVTPAPQATRVTVRLLIRSLLPVRWGGGVGNFRNQVDSMEIQIWPRNR